jgi:hypothetical protein
MADTPCGIRLAAAHSNHALYRAEYSERKNATAGSRPYQNAVAENAATTAQLMAIYDWSTPAQAEVYIRAANRTRLANQAMPLLAKWMDRTGIVLYRTCQSSFVAPERNQIVR